MPDLQLDEEQMIQWVAWPHSTPVCDPQGEKLGGLVSSEFFRKLAYAWAREEFTEEEWQRNKAVPGGLTTAELLAQLEAAAPTTEIRDRRKPRTVLDTMRETNPAQQRPTTEGRDSSHPRTRPPTDVDSSGSELDVRSAK